MFDISFGISTIRCSDILKFLLCLGCRYIPIARIAGECFHIIARIAEIETEHTIPAIEIARIAE